MVVDERCMLSITDHFVHREQRLRTLLVDRIHLHPPSPSPSRGWLNGVGAGGDPEWEHPVGVYTRSSSTWRN